jgi:peptidoglycan/xylan/chitin deacetylase (PgdA/CDA1 family)
MDNSSRESDSVINRREVLALAGISGVTALTGYAGAETTTTEALAQRDTETRAEDDGTTTTGSQSAGGPLSPLPTPERDTVPQPSGPAENLVVLDWAGFESAISYTFDDGQPSHLEHYDELKNTGISSTFYISSNVDFPGYEEGWRQVAADGNEIGNHTVSHPYADLAGSAFGEPLESTAAEIKQCTEYIIQTFNQRDVWTMAAPYGDTEWIEPAKEAAVFLNRGVGRGTIAPNDCTNPFNLPCYVASAGETAEKFNALADSSHSNGEWLIYLFHSITPTHAKWYAPVNISEITKNINHVKSLDSVWIDTVANIGAYWLGQRILDSTTPTTAGDDKVWTWTLPDGFPQGQYLRVRTDGGTLKQGSDVLEWDSHGYYEVSLDEGSLTLSPSSTETGNQNGC